MKRYFLFLTLFFLLITTFVFSGTIKISALVDGSDYIKIKGNSVWVEHRNYEPIKDLKYKFDPESGLPDEEVSIDLRKEEGSGPVTIVQKPSRDNNYTLTILVNNDNEDVYPQLYKFTVYFKERNSIYSSGIDKSKYDFVHWRGSVDGKVFLIFHENKVETERERGKKIEDMRYSYSNKIPGSNFKVMLKKIEGRGNIKIVENPSYNNNYSVKVLVDDGPYRGRDIYDFYLYWEKENSENKDLDFYWEGKVDGSDYIIVKDNNVTIKHIEAKKIRDMHYKFYSYLPHKSQNVELFVLRGRGKVKIVEQPSYFNRYSVKILIEDPQGGDYKYKIGLKWNEGTRRSIYEKNSNKKYENEKKGVIRWRGRVDGVVELRFRRDYVTSGVIRGRKIKGAKVTFFKKMPKEKIKVHLNKISGRGSIEILQQPTKYNDYSVVVRIIDPQRGAGYYEFELYW